jgi:hypothetical protein
MYALCQLAYSIPSPHPAATLHSCHSYTVCQLGRSLDPVSLMATKLTTDSELEPLESLLWDRYDGAVTLQTLQASGWPAPAGRRPS